MTNDKQQSQDPTPPKRFWIVGAGRFGQIAIERISGRYPDATLTVVDRQPADTGHAGIRVVQMDGIQWLKFMLVPKAPVDVIVPAIPVHVTAEWLKVKLSEKYDIHSVKIPASWRSQLPNAIGGNVGQVYVSHADFICPDNCPEPKNICTHTGKPRPLDLFRLLSRLELGHVRPIVLRSRQLLPGVGGIYPSELINALGAVIKSSRHPVMIATACRCHGVADFIRLTKKAPGKSDHLDILPESR